MTLQDNNFSMSDLYGFIEFEKNQKKVMRGNVEMYDVKWYHKFLSLRELFDWYIKNK